MPGEYGKFNLYDTPLPGERGGRSKRKKYPRRYPPGSYSSAAPYLDYGGAPSAPPLPGSSSPSTGGFSGYPYPGRYRYDPTTGMVTEEPGGSEPLPGAPRSRKKRYSYDPTTGMVSEVAAGAGEEEEMGGFGPFPDFETWERAFTEEHGRPPTSQDVEDAIDSFYFMEMFGRPPTQEEWEVRALTGRWGTYWRGGGGGGGGRRPYQTGTGGAANMPWLPGLYSWRI